MPQLTVTIDVPDDTYHRIMAFDVASRMRFDAALTSAVIEIVANLDKTEINEESGISQSDLLTASSPA